MRDVLVRLSAVSKHYRRGAEVVHVLHAIDLEVERAEFVAFMGPSGSGKSTLLNLIGGLDRPDSGRVVVAGEDIHEYADRALAAWRAAQVGFVFQAYNLLSALSALQNVALPLLLTRLPRPDIRRRAETALRIVGLEGRFEHRPRELSGGQEQRVAIARALVTDPALLICDEPTGGLDRATADDVLGLLGTLNRDHGKTIVMVTHDPRAAERARRVLTLDKGVLVAEPSPSVAAS